MNISDFTYILQNPTQINVSQTEAIEAITKEFPYFQAARVVHLKGLKNQDSFKYNQNLKVAAAYTTDRSILFDFITSRTFDQHKISSTIKESHNNTNEIEVAIEEVKIDQNLLMEDAIKTKIEEANAILDPDLFQPKVTETLIPIAAVAEIKKDKKKKGKKKDKKKKKSKDKKVVAKKIEIETIETPEETLQLGKPLAFEQSEKHSFSQWLQLASLKPIDRSVDQSPEKEVVKEPEIVAKEPKRKASKEEKRKRFDLISKFIDKNPKIKPKPTLQKTINLASETNVDQSMLMTETLAKVYLEQKKYKKAMKAYDILILKYPEKSGFFADRIRAIKKLQQKN
ncbi:hypothetical protein IMCC3317_23340 [Kordia antarctica]|uniref:Tetratricopeptide repeat protein n=1 Tax=Kordia antarctica TaxID=1218801 RepID=A0A7L4ZJS2_9FLAO|nr:hypothetical protein [Kordia antarctica]QHI36963.1 hypothetical protein IMCC3317_23340 [Kordia antarctica]